jgi:hypothetical protein
MWLNKKLGLLSALAVAVEIVSAHLLLLMTAQSIASKRGRSYSCPYLLSPGGSEILVETDRRLGSPYRPYAKTARRDAGTDRGENR